MDMEATPLPQTQEVTNMSTDDFLSLRADWKAAGRPADHPYMRLELPGETNPQPLTGLVSAEAVERVRTDPAVRSMLDNARDRRFG